MINALIENLPDTNEAYEYDKDLHLLYTMPSDVRWPYYYGCIPEIKSGDGAPLDIFVISDTSYERGAFLKVKLFDVLIFIDRGLDDPKLLAVPVDEASPSQDEVRKIYDAITTFIAAKKRHSGTKFEFKGLGGPDLARSLIENSAS